MQQSRDVRPPVATLDPPPARHPHGSDPASSLLPPPPPTRQPGEESSRASAGPSPVRPGGGEEEEEEEGGGDVDSPQDLSRKDGVGVPAAERRYECRHCHLATRDLAVFSAHVDAAHPGVLANPLYVCRACRFRSSLRSEFDAHNRRRHRSLGRMKLRITKMPDRTVLEQSPVGRALDVGGGGGDDGDDRRRRSAETSPATPAVAQPSDDAEGGAVPNPSGLSARRSPRPPFEKPNGAEPRRRLTDAAAENGAAAREPAAKTAAAAAAVPRSRQHQRRQEDRAGGLQIFNPALPHIVLNASKIAQGDPAFASAAFDGAPAAGRARGGGAAEDDATTAAAAGERPAATADDDDVAEGAAPATDDAGRMDGDRHLLAAFARFPYPSSGDIAWLASVTPFAEGRLRGWFAARRAARAISWSPGEIEERRRRLVASTMATLLMSGPGAETHDGPGAQPDVAASKQPATGEGRPPSALVVDQAAAVTPVELPAPSPDVSAARAHESSSSSSSSSPLALTLTASSVRSPSPSTAPSASSSSSSSSPPPPPPPDLAPPCDAPALPSPCRGPRGKHKKSKEQLARLKRSFARNRHPDEGELRRLVGATGLGRSEVKKWFSDGRYRRRDGGDGAGGRAGPRRPSAARFFHRNLPTMCPLEFVGRMSIVDSLNRAAKARHRPPGEEGGGAGAEAKAAGAAAVTAAAAAAEYEEAAADGRRGDRSEPGGAGERAAGEAADADEEVSGFYGDEPARVGARPRPPALDGARPAGGPHPEPRGRLIAKIKIPRDGGNYEHVKPSLSGEIRAGLRGGCSAPPAHAAYADHTAHTVRAALIAHTAQSKYSHFTHSAHFTHFTHSAHFTHSTHSEHSTHFTHSPHSVHSAHTTHTGAHEAHASRVSAHGTHAAHGTLAANATPTDRPRSREFTPPPPPSPEPRSGPERHRRPGSPGLLDAPGRRTAVVKPSVRRPKKTKEQLSVLKAVFGQTQWPTPEAYVALVARTGLPRSDIVRWFGDTRFAYKHGQLRWIRGQRCEPADGRAAAAAAAAAARTRPARGRGSRRHAGEFLRSPDGHGGGGGGGGGDSAERGKAALPHRFHVDARASCVEPALAMEEAGGGAGRRGEGDGAGERR
uniref:Zinc fingers and homeoboxes protein 1-like n=1 Tax=Petromyzon marinus TaxID=7757 RepID=A0AAJ7UBM7_PETMA|nr:zinc fingers and homeoboxes protein 1-like [Petromyzon marinus]